jgi:hypothetical protein
MNYTLLTNEEMEKEIVGEAITLSAVMAIVAVAIAAVLIYRLFMSGEGGVSITGGWKFSWE